MSWWVIFGRDGEEKSRAVDSSSLPNVNLFFYILSFLLPRLWDRSRAAEGCSVHNYTKIGLMISASGLIS